MGRIEASLLTLSCSHSLRGRLEKGACCLFCWGLDSQKLQTVDPDCAFTAFPGLCFPGRRESNPLVWEGLSALYL